MRREQLEERGVALPENVRDEERAVRGVNNGELRCQRM